MILQIGILLLVTGQRLWELVFARKNTARLMAAGGYEVGASHYTAMVLLHASWLGGLWWFAPAQTVIWPILGIYILLQVFRVWTLSSIGQRWTTRIIIVPGETLVARGPYRYFRHPNYMLVVAEIFCLPAVFGLWELAAIFTVLNAAMLVVRIRAENQALQDLR